MLIDSASVVRDVIQTDEFAALEPSLTEQQLAPLAQAAHEAIHRLALLGAHAGAPPYVSASQEQLSDDDTSSLCGALKGLVVQMYSRFTRLRAGMRRKMRVLLASAVGSASSLPPSSLSVSLHTLDGGSRSSGLSLEGVKSLLEIVTGP